MVSFMHPSTCQASHYYCKLVKQIDFREEYSLSISVLPEEHHLGLVGACECEAPAEQRPWLALILDTGV